MCYLLDGAFNLLDGLVSRFHAQVSISSLITCKYTSIRRNGKTFGQKKRLAGSFFCSGHRFQTYLPTFLSVLLHDEKPVVILFGHVWLSSNRIHFQIVVHAEVDKGSRITIISDVAQLDSGSFLLLIDEVYVVLSELARGIADPLSGLGRTELLCQMVLTIEVDRGKRVDGSQ